MPHGDYPPSLVEENRKRLGISMEQYLKDRQMNNLFLPGYSNHHQAHVSLGTEAKQELQIQELEEDVKRLKRHIMEQQHTVQKIESARAKEIEMAMHDWSVKRMKRELEWEHNKLRQKIARSRRKGFVPMLAIVSPTVYLLSYEGEVVYVGQSKTPYQRIHQHKDKKFDHVRFLPCKLRRMSYWEKVLIKRYKPHYNRTGY